jgi:hypothetical protein
VTAEEDLRAFARAVYGGCSGYVEVAYFKGRSKRAMHIPVDEFIADPTPLLELPPQRFDVYLGCVTTNEAPEFGRGKNRHRLDVPGAWLDLDVETDGHHRPRGDGRRHLRDQAEALELLKMSGLPEPTALIHSGGGLYAWWLFDQPLVLQDDDADRAAALSLSAAINQHVSSVAADRLDVGVDKVGDVVRVLRPPGVFNWKNPLAAKPVQLLSLDEELRVSVDDLTSVIEDISLGPRFTPTSANKRSTSDEERGPSLPDAVRAASWEELLFPLGWTYGASVSGATSFLRPGHSVDAGAKPGDGYGGSSGGDDGAKSAVVYLDGPENLVVFSDATGLPVGTGQDLTKFTVMSLIHFPHASGERKKSWAAATHDLGQAALARHAGACCAADETSSQVRSIWPAPVLDAALDTLGGGWRSGGSTWTVQCVDGLRRVRKKD